MLSALVQVETTIYAIVRTEGFNLWPITFSIIKIFFYNTINTRVLS
jgi:hypothetical protein